MIRLIGIDPGVNTGFAVLADGEFEALWTLSFWGAYHLVRGSWEPLEVDVVVVEIATISYVWQPSAKRARQAKALRVAQDVGAVRREGELLAEGLRDRFTVITKPPCGKLNADRFAKLTGHDGRTNQHERDAAMLAWNEYQSMKQRKLMAFPETAITNR